MGKHCCFSPCRRLGGFILHVSIIKNEHGRYQVFASVHYPMKCGYVQLALARACTLLYISFATTFVSLVEKIFLLCSITLDKNCETGISSRCHVHCCLHF